LESELASLRSGREGLHHAVSGLPQNANAPSNPFARMIRKYSGQVKAHASLGSQPANPRAFDFPFASQAASPLLLPQRVDHSMRHGAQERDRRYQTLRHDVKGELLGRLRLAGERLLA
jgi:hypothetical protein